MSINPTYTFPLCARGDVTHNMTVCKCVSMGVCCREVETLFHEFGHALQHMMTTVDEGLVAGIR